MRNVFLAAGLYVSVFAAPPASAAPIVDYEGNAIVSLATGSATISLSGNTLTGTLTNTSPHDARIMGFGSEIGGGTSTAFRLCQRCTGTTTNNDCRLDGGASPNNAQGTRPWQGMNSGTRWAINIPK